MNYFSTNPNDVGITVVGGTTGLGETTQEEIEQKIESVKESLRVKKTQIDDEFWTTQKSDLIDELHETHPNFKVGEGD